MKHTFPRETKFKYTTDLSYYNLRAFKMFLRGWAIYGVKSDIWGAPAGKSIHADDFQTK